MKCMPTGVGCCPTGDPAVPYAQSERPQWYTGTAVLPMLSEWVAAVKDSWRFVLAGRNRL